MSNQDKHLWPKRVAIAAWAYGMVLSAAPAIAAPHVVVGVYSPQITEGFYVGQKFTPSSRGAILFRKLEADLATYRGVGAAVEHAKVFQGPGKHFLVCGQAVDRDTRAQLQFVYVEGEHGAHIGLASPGMEESLGCNDTRPHEDLGFGPAP